MNVRTIEISRETAMQKLAAYRGLNARQRTAEDERLEALYKSVSAGARVINILEAFRATGLNDAGEPKLALVEGDWKDVFFMLRGDGSGRFRRVSDFWRENLKTISMPEGTFERQLVRRVGEVISAPVPHVPPDVRPNSHLRNFHILFEVEKWTTVEYPRDPFLLRHISGYLYVVVAEWELTELEASLLGSMRTGN